jgi:phosphopantothenoylcysteine decarboxylase/phosphopantothenate--cysteine ligase
VNVLLGITGSIAAYKALELIRLLKKEGADVKVVFTQSALHFVTPLSCQTLSGNEVHKEQFMLTAGIKHLTVADWADIFVIAPATANIIGKAASGIGDDLLSTTLLSFQKPILFVPAMDEGMWENKIVQKNVHELKRGGIHFLEPSSGLLASGKVGKGRFPRCSLIYKKMLLILEKNKPLLDTKFLITGGRTEEDIDSVRVITNRSSGMMAVELLETIMCREGEVKGILGEVNVPLPEEMEILRVRTSHEMLKVLRENVSWCHCLIMAAAVGDYKPRSRHSTKVHTKKIHCELHKNKDILKEVNKQKGKRVYVGFSLEDTIDQKRARKKLKAKNLDIIVVNPVQAIGNNQMSAHILTRSGKSLSIGKTTKAQLANKILDECMHVLEKKKR